ncbi:MAG TPA: hypothetical protein VKF32_14065, partial [Thermoanaerobaculia bacterium]|nr:hypothetical protein [Thermoanaerobaculia bacterium]
MIGALALFQIAIAASTAERQAVAAGPTDLSYVASRVHLNLKALEGWVPKKGTPPPPIEWPEIVVAPEPRRRVAERERVEEEPPYDPWGSVNAYGAPPIPFYGSGRAHRPRSFGPRPPQRQLSGARPPGRMTRGSG